MLIFTDEGGAYKSSKVGKDKDISRFNNDGEEYFNVPLYRSRCMNFYHAVWDNERSKPLCLSSIFVWAWYILRSDFFKISQSHLY